MLSLALVGRPLLNKALIQLSADGWGCTPSLIFVWPEMTQPWGATRLYDRVKSELQEILHQGGPFWPNRVDAHVPVVSLC